MNRALTILVFLALTIPSMAQNAGIGTTTPTASTQPDVRNTTKGFLHPRMTTTQGDLITSPDAGLVIYNTTTNSVQLYNGSGWLLLSPSFVPFLLLL